MSSAHDDAFAIPGDWLRKPDVAKAVWEAAIESRSRVAPSESKLFDALVSDTVRLWGLPGGWNKPGRRVPTSLLRKHARDFIKAVQNTREFGTQVAFLWSASKKELLATAGALVLEKRKREERADLRVRKGEMDALCAELVERTGEAPDFAALMLTLVHRRAEFQRAVAAVKGVVSEEARAEPAIPAPVDSLAAAASAAELRSEEHPKGSSDGFAAAASPASDSRDSSSGEQSAIGTSESFRMGTAEDAPMLLRAALRRLAAAADDSAEWEQAEALAGEIQQRARDRTGRLARRSVAALNAALAALQEEPVRAALGSLEKLTGHDRWSADRIPAASAADLTAHIARLDGLLRAFADAWAQMGAARVLVERQRLMDEAVALQGAIEPLYRTVERYFDSGEVAVPPADGSAPAVAQTLAAESQSVTAVEPSICVPYERCAEVAQNTAEVELDALPPTPAVEVSDDAEAPLVGLHETSGPGRGGPQTEPTGDTGAIPEVSSGEPSAHAPGAAVIESKSMSEAPAVLVATPQPAALAPETTEVDARTARAPNDSAVEALSSPMTTAVAAAVPLPEVGDAPPVGSASLLSRAEAARRYLADPGPATEHALLFAVVADGDLSGAYWLARSAEHRKQSAVPAWLLRALAGSELLTGDGFALVGELFEIALANDVPNDPFVQALAMAAGINAIGAPGTGLANWITDVRGMGFLHPIIEKLREFERLGLGLSSGLQELIESGAERRERVAAASNKARRWFEAALKKRTTYAPATFTWRGFLESGGLARMLNAAMYDRRGELSEVKDLLEKWRDSSHVEREIRQSFSSSPGEYKRFVGNARNWLGALVEEACAHVTEWHDLVSLDQSLKAREDHDRTARHLGEMRSALERLLPAAWQGLAAHEAGTRTAPEAAAVAVLGRALARLSALFFCRTPSRAAALPADVAGRSSLFTRGGSLRQLLARRLLAYPDLRLPRDGSPWAPHLSSLPHLFAEEVLAGQGVRLAIDGWFARRDLRFVPELLDALQNAQQKEELGQRLEELRQKERKALRDRIAGIRREIERAVLDGVLGDERAELQGRLELDVDRVDDFGTVEETLRSVEAALAECRDRFVEKVRERWRALQPKLHALPWDDAAREAAVSRINEVLTADDYRSADELLSRLSEAVERNEPPDPSLFAPPGRADSTLESFLARLPEFDSRLANLRGRAMVDAAFQLLSASAPGLERDGLVRLLEHWMVLAQTLPNDRARVADVLAQLMVGLGFELTSDLREPVRPPENGQHRTWLVRAKAPGSPVPQLGSLCEDQWRVLLHWPQGGDPLAGLLSELRSDADGLLVLVFGRISAQRRRDLAAHCRRNGAAALLVDEWLLLHAGSHAAAQRLRALFDGGLAFSGLNPYSQRAGPVPPEMFFGREGMARALASFDETCLVYGGRQLGKSALLERVRREFARPGEHRYAISLDIKELGDPAADQVPEHLWSRLREELKKQKFLKPQITTADPDAVGGHIREVLDERREAKLLILLDEADNFLDADSQRGFEQVKRLRELMRRHPGRCKVVLAGLHNVQRFRGIPNQPLAHFGSDLLIGPLDPADADALVRRPLEALGFRFVDSEKNGAILRILGYTNYHPLLLQLFCRSLVQLLQRRADFTVPQPISEKDVEEVYRQGTTRQQIRERFELTLALDPRYQAIVWSMILDQSEAQDGFAQGYKVADALGNMRKLWPQGFEATDSEQMRALLEEMVGLGVLVHGEGGRYRLRSPNVVRLLGTIDDIWARFDELSKTKPMGLDVDAHRVRLGDEGSLRYSPLTLAQSRALNDGTTGVALVFGTKASGIEALPGALDRLFGASEQAPLRRFVALPAASGRKELEEALNRASAEHKDAESIVLFRELGTHEARSGELVRVAKSFCEQRRSRKRWIKVVFALRPAAAWEWLGSEEPENEALPQLNLRRWTEPAVGRLLDSLDLASTNERLQKILERTGGWHEAIERFAKICPRGGDESKALDALEGWMGTGLAFELEGVPRAAEVLGLLASLGHADVSTKFEEILDGDVSALAGRSRLLLRLLQRLGCLELKDGRYTAEKVAAKVVGAA